MSKKNTNKNGRSLNSKSSANQLTTEERRAIGVRSAYQKKIKEALMSQARYTKELDILIANTAGTLAMRDRVMAEIDALKSLTITEATKFSEKIVEHPLLSMYQKFTREASSQLRLLRLTGVDVEITELDELSKFDEQINPS